MSVENRGAGRRGEEPTPSQAGRSEQKQTPQQRGEGIRGVPPPAKPQQQRGGDNPGRAMFDCVVPKLGPDSLMNRVVKVGERLDDVQWRLGKTELIHEPPPITAEEMRRLEKQERRLQNEYLSLRKKISEFQHKQLKELRNKDLQ